MPTIVTRFDRLPRWAQDAIRQRDQAIERLTAELDGLRRQLAPGPDGSNVFAEPHGNQRPLGRDTRIRFGTVEDGAFDAEPGEDCLIVSLYALNATDLAICPLSSNSVRLRKIRRR